MNKLLAAPGTDSTESSSTPMPSTSTPAPNADGISEAPSGPTDADVAAVDTMMDELGLPADEKAAMDAMMAAAQAGETPSNEMIQKAQRAGEHMNKLLATAGADSTESSSTPMPSTSTPAPNADGISEAPSSSTPMPSTSTPAPNA